jgi:hypothetical protein
MPAEFAAIALLSDGRLCCTLGARSPLCALARVGCLGLGSGCRRSWTRYGSQAAVKHCFAKSKAAYLSAVKCLFFASGLLKNKIKFKFE